MQCLDSNCKRCGADLKCLECNQLPHIEVRLGEGEGQRGVHLHARQAPAAGPRHTCHAHHACLYRFAAQSAMPTCQPAPFVCFTNLPTSSLLLLQYDDNGNAIGGGYGLDPVTKACRRVSIFTLRCARSESLAVVAVAWHILALCCCWNASPQCCTVCPGHPNDPPLHLRGDRYFLPCSAPPPAASAARPTMRGAMPAAAKTACPAQASAATAATPPPHAPPPNAYR